MHRNVQKNNKSVQLGQTWQDWSQHCCSNTKYTLVCLWKWDTVKENSGIGHW